jgi:hypothetical protein
VTTRLTAPFTIGEVRAEYCCARLAGHSSELVCTREDVNPAGEASFQLGHDHSSDSFLHRDGHATLSRDLFGALVAGVDMPDHPHAGIVGQYARQLLRG